MAQGQCRTHSLLVGLPPGAPVTLALWNHLLASSLEVVVRRWSGEGLVWAYSPFVTADERGLGLLRTPAECLGRSTICRTRSDDACFSHTPQCEATKVRVCVCVCVAWASTPAEISRSIPAPERAQRFHQTVVAGLWTPYSAIPREVGALSGAFCAPAHTLLSRATLGTEPCSVCLVWCRRAVERLTRAARCRRWWEHRGHVARRLQPYGWQSVQRWRHWVWCRRSAGGAGG